MFCVLDKLSIVRHETAPVLYRNLVMLFGKLTLALVQEHFMQCFVSFYKNSNAPMAILLD